MTDPALDVEFVRVPEQRIASLTRRAAAWGSSSIGPVVGPMFPEVLALLGGAPTGPAVAVYREDADGVEIVAGFEVGDEVSIAPGLDVRVLPALDRAAVALHVGPMDTIDRSWTALMDAVRAAGAEPAPGGREVYLTPGDRPQSEWRTRLIQPLA